MKDTNKYQTRADGMHYRQAFGRTIDVVNLDEGVPGTVRFSTGQTERCVAFKDLTGREYGWLIALENPYQGGPDYERGKPIKVDMTVEGTEWKDLLVYAAPESAQMHSRDKFKREKSK